MKRLSTKHRDSLFVSNDLNGLTGDNGEQYCLFFGATNPLEGTWAWFHTETEAVKFYNNKTADENRDNL